MEVIAPKVLQNFANGHLFRVNARRALALRCAGASGNEVAATGLPALVERLQHVIFKERLPLVLDAIMKGTVEPARRKATSVIHSTQEELRVAAHVTAKGREAEQRKQAENLQELHQKVLDIRNTSDSLIEDFGGRVASRVEKTLEEILAEWEDDWETCGLGDYTRGLIKRDLVKEAGRVAARDALAGRIASHFEQKIEEKITPESLERIFTEGVGELKMEVASFGELLADLRPEIGTGTGIIAVILLQPWLAVALVPLGLIGVVAPEWIKRRASDKLRDVIHGGLVKGLRSEMPGIQRDIREKTREGFQPYFDNLHRILHENIEREKERLHRVTGLKIAGEAEVAAEIERLETIATCLAAQFEAIHCEIYPGLPPAVVKEETKN